MARRNAILTFQNHHILAAWRFVDYCSEAGNDLIEEWYLDLPDETQAEFDVTRNCAGSAGTGERALRGSVDTALRAGIFKASGSFDPMGLWGVGAKGDVPAPVIIVSMSPPGYPSAGLPPSRARFRFTRLNAIVTPTLKPPADGAADAAASGLLPACGLARRESPPAVPPACPPASRIRSRCATAACCNARHSARSAAAHPRASAARPAGYIRSSTICANAPTCRSTADS